MVGQLGMMAASAGMGLIQDLWQQNLAKKAEGRQMVNNKALMDYEQQKQLEMWEKTGYKAQMKQMKSAGLNPALMYGMSGGGAQTTGSFSSGASQGNVNSNIGMGMQMGLQAAMMKAQIENIEADTAKKREEVPNVQADTENKILASVIAKYTGLEMKDVYEQISSQPGQRYAQAKEKEGSALGNAAIGYNLWRMHESGDLQNKSWAEIEEILLKNAKTREERNLILKQIEAIEKQMKGTDLDNAMKELELELTQKLGLSKDSNQWMRIIGRLFLQLTGL